MKASPEPVRIDDAVVAIVGTDLVEQVDELLVGVAVEYQLAAVGVQRDFKDAARRAGQASIGEGILVGVEVGHGGSPVVLVGSMFGEDQAAGNEGLDAGDGALHGRACRAPSSYQRVRFGLSSSVRPGNCATPQPAEMSDVGDREVVDLCWLKALSGQLRIHKIPRYVPPRR